MGFASVLKQGYALMAELHAMLLSQITFERKLNHIIIKSDPTLALHMVNNFPPLHPKHTKIVCRIRQLLDNQRLTRLIHTFRESNKLADGLANWALNKTCKLRVWTNLFDINLLVISNVTGASTPCLVNIG